MALMTGPAAGSGTAPGPELSVTVHGPGTVAGPGFNCRSACTARYPRGTEVRLYARPALGSIFLRWHGGCEGEGRQCSLTMTDDRFVSAKFRRLRPKTKITDSEIDGRRGRARFRFKVLGAYQNVQCALLKGGRKPNFKRCRQHPDKHSKTYRHLDAGRYTFEVRAIGPGGHPELTPARKSFRIR